METPEFTPRGIAKAAVKFVIAASTAKKAADAVADYTRFEKDNMLVDFSAALIGSYVAEKIAPYTDKMVDKTADFVTAKRGKKDPTPTTA